MGSIKGVKRGEYNKNTIREEIKDFIVSLYEKGISYKLEELKEDIYHDLFLKYTGLIARLNESEKQSGKKNYKVRDPNSQKDYQYFYTEGTRHIVKKPIKKDFKRQKEKLKFVNNKTLEEIKTYKKTQKEIVEIKKDIKKEIKNTEEILQELLARSGAYGLYQAKMLELYQQPSQYQGLNYYQLKMKRKEIGQIMLIELQEYVRTQLKKATVEGSKIPTTLISDIGNLIKSTKDFDSADKYDVSIPKDVVVAIQQNNFNKSIDNDNTENGDNLFLKMAEQLQQDKKE